jgi:signal transduction histidine kinase
VNLRASMYKKGQHLRLSRDGLAAWTRSIGIAAGVGIAYFLAAELSNGFLITPETVIFWPAAGISSGALISLWSIARWPILAGVMIATAAANLLRYFGVAATATWVLGNTAEPLIIALLIQYYFGAHFKIDRLYCVLGLFAAAVVGTAVASTWWTFVYYWLFGSLKEPTATWLHWIVSDLAGVVSVAPLVIGIATAPRRLPPRREVIKSIAALAVLGAMTGVIVSLPLELWNTVVPAALVFPVLLWLAARWQPVFSAAGAFIVSMTVALTAIYGFGHFGDSSLSVGARTLQTQAIILVVSFGTAVLAALFAERRENEGRLFRSNTLLERERENKLMNVQAVIAAIAHEARQPIGAITMNADAALRWLERTPRGQEKAREALDDIKNESQRVSEVFDGLRALFGKVDQEREPVDVNDTILSVIQSLQGRLNDHGVAVYRELAVDLPPTAGHSAQLREVISNLVNNALEAMGSTTNRRRELHLRTELRDRDTIAIAIQDTGPGIDPKTLAGIFGAFFTTKPHGTGLGLAICRMIVERHGGQLTASSDGKSGALFQFTLPIEAGGQNGNSR